MPTNEERREVAQLMREWEPKHGMLLWYDLANCLGIKTTMNARDALDMLSDLIEPEPERTCNRVKLYDAGGVWYEGCSKCRNPLDDYDVYCSKCGAKVLD